MRSDLPIFVFFGRLCFALARTRFLRIPFDLDALRAFAYSAGGIACLFCFAWGYKMNMRFACVAVLSVLVVCFISCGDDYESDDYADPITVLSLDADHVRFVVRPEMPELVERNIDGQTFTSLAYKNAVALGEEGAPAIPAYCRLIAIPQGANVTVEVEQGAVTVLDDVLLPPVQPPMPESSAAPDFMIDAAAYETDSVMPTRNVFFEDHDKILRGVRVNHLWISPVRYNPATRRAELIDELTVTVRFEGGGEFLKRPELASRSLATMLENFALNFDALPPMKSKAETGDDGADMLVVTAERFLPAALRLAEWKRRCGIMTRVVTVEEIGTTVDEIKPVLQAAYLHPTRPISYALFLGDAEFIPVFYKTFHSGHFTLLGTDFYYSLLDGADMLPDIATGRVPVDTLEQAEDFVEAVIEYESNPVEAESYYTNSWHAAYFQDDNHNNEEDRRFTLTSEEMVRWFSEQVPEAGITPHRCYYTDQRNTPRKWNNDIYGWFADWWELSQQDLPEELLRASGHAWDCDATKISAAVNAGTFFLVYRGHGSKYAWADPSYTFIDTSMLKNGEQKPVVFSINCMTGWFDNETDSLIDFTPDFRLNFAETWLRNPDGGAIGLIAPTRTSYSGYNDRLIWGWMDAIWPGYIPGYPAEEGKPSESERPAMGDVLNYGKLYLTTVYAPVSTRKVEIEMFHWLGDPTLRMWTAKPEKLTAEHKKLVTADGGAFTVEVSRPGSRVVLTVDGKVIADQLAADTVASFVLPALPESTTIDLTVTKDGFVPYLAEIAVGQCASDADCNDNLFCNGMESCNADGYCVAGDAPCDNSACDEQADACAETDDDGDDDDDIEADKGLDASDDDSDDSSGCGG